MSEYQTVTIGDTQLRYNPSAKRKVIEIYHQIGQRWSPLYSDRGTQDLDALWQRWCEIQR